MIAKIAVSAAIYSIDKPYDYLIPSALSVQVGSRVIVPFGRGNRQCEGVVLALAEASDSKKLKEILSVLDAPVEEELLRLAAFLRQRCFCTYYDALKTVLPAGLWYRVTNRYCIARQDWQNALPDGTEAKAIMEALADLGGAGDEQILRKSFGEEVLSNALKVLLAKGFLTKEAEHHRAIHDKTEAIVRLTSSAEEATAYCEKKGRTAPLQKAALELLCIYGECSVKELSYYTGATAATLKRLETLGYVELCRQPALRIPAALPVGVAEPLCLNVEQRTAYDGIRRQAQQETPGVALLYGVTGSGKTAVYIQLISDCLAEGKSAMLLVPEIALTPQLLALFTAHFGKEVAVLHSELRLSQRYDTWKQIRDGKFRVVLGTRSAVFAPLKKLGLLILDEEQEHTYKSENNPRYHAREVAIYRGNKASALVLLGSATPSVESMYRARQGIYGFYTMQNRYNRGPLPPVQIVDMKEELRSGNPTAISRPLLTALEENIAQGRQAILFLNRRGSSPMTACVECGFVPECPGCSIHLTYHRANGRLMCHRCGYAEPLAARCPQCGGPFKQVGFGTQKVEEQLQRLLPGVEVLRMDADTVSATNPHEKLLRRFQEEKIPILLGTQMVAKGLNFENVTLVGVLDGDSSLYAPSYRGSENTFSLITQVVGRAGRGELQGRALIQTMTPRNQVITLAAKQDYDSFFAMELPLRQLRGCPPYRDLIQLTFHGLREEQVVHAAWRFRQELEEALRQQPEDVVLLGPAPAQMARVNYSHRCCLTLSCRNSRSLRELLAELMRSFPKKKENKEIGVFADVNSNE